MTTNVQQEIERLREMSTSQLAEWYAQLFGERTRTRHREYLLRKLAWRMQALAEGDLSERARQRAEELAHDADARVTPPKSERMTSTPVKSTVVSAADPRLPSPGTAIVRKYKGTLIRVLVLRDGFEYEGERYQSLSAVAKKISGTHCNGFRFFGLEAK